MIGIFCTGLEPESFLYYRAIAGRLAELGKTEACEGVSFKILAQILNEEHEKKHETHPKKTANSRTELLNQYVPNMTQEVNIAHTQRCFDQNENDASGNILVNRD